MIESFQTAFSTWMFRIAVCGLVALGLWLAVSGICRLLKKKLRQLAGAGILAMLMCALALAATLTNNFPTLEEKEELLALQAQEQVELRSLARLLVPQEDQLPCGETLPNLLGSVAESKTFPHWAQGVYADGQRVVFDSDWVFPCGTGHLASVEVLSDGAILPDGFAAEPIAAFAAHLSLVPGVSAFHYGRTPSNSYEFVWTDARDGRIGGTPFSGRIELFRNGDVAIDANGSAALLPRTLPFAHDGFGQDATWIEANFARLQALSPSLTNAAEILSVGYANWVDAQVGVGLTNGLYKFTATFPEAPSEATLLTVGDYSVAVTNAGDYTFILGKGTEYGLSVSPFDASVTYDAVDDTGTRLMYCAIRASQANAGSNHWSADSSVLYLAEPSLLYPGRIFWMPMLFVTPDCWYPENEPPTKTFSAVLLDAPETCTPTYHWYGRDDLVSIATPDAPTTAMTILGPSSHCGWLASVDMELYGETLTASLSMDSESDDIQLAIETNDTIFSNNDDDDFSGEVDYGETMPDEPWDDNEVVSATISLTSDEPISGTLTITPQWQSSSVQGWTDWRRQTEVSEPIVLNCAEITSTSHVFSIEGKAQSNGYRTEGLNVVWTGDDGTTRSESRKFTTVMCLAQPITNSFVTLPNGQTNVVNACQVVVNDYAIYSVSVFPDSYPDEKITWSVEGDGEVEFVGGNRGRTVTVKGVSPGVAKFNINVGGAAGETPCIPFEVIPDFSEVQINAWILSDGIRQTASEAHVRECIATANAIYHQVGMRFVLHDLIVTNVPSIMMHIDEGATNGIPSSQMLAWGSFTDGIECYFITDFVGESDSVAITYRPRNKIAMSESADGLAFAHELGHVCGLDDIYDSHDGTTLSVSGKVSDLTVDLDWSGGTGFRYYPTTLEQSDLLKRLLMYGYTSPFAMDIPLGHIEGVYYYIENEVRIYEYRLAPRSGVFRYFNKQPRSLQ